MGKKRKPNSGGYVYSTDPDFDFEPEVNSSFEKFPPEKQKLKVLLERKNRAGKTVTVVSGFVGADEELEALCKALKNHCGTGGSAKDNEIIIQGDQSEKVLHWLSRNGFTQSKKI